MYRIVDGIPVWGEPESDAVNQIKTCAKEGSVFQTALMADHHKGYSQPIGGVVAYHNAISPSGVGYDIACGNKAVRTDLLLRDIRKDLPKIAKAISSRVSFGIGRNNQNRVDHELFDDPAWKEVRPLWSLRQMAQNQLGTVGSGNHYVDILIEEESQAVWVAVHFGSRGFGHKTASGFLNLAAGREFSDKSPGESMDQKPTILEADSELGQDYLEAMRLAGRYAYAGRDYVVDQVLDILKTRADFEVHNHHNFAWKEEHNGQKVYVVRKGATPCFPDQLGFVRGSMADISVIIRGKDSDESQTALYSTVHGAGRVMSRTKAAGKKNWKTGERSGGLISKKRMQEAVEAFGVYLHGAGTDESPFVYRKLKKVLNAHAETLEVIHVLKPVVVVMAGEDEFDPYKD